MADMNLARTFLQTTTLKTLDTGLGRGICKEVAAGVHRWAFTEIRRKELGVGVNISASADNAVPTIALLSLPLLRHKVNFLHSSAINIRPWLKMDRIVTCYAFIASKQRDTSIYVSSCAQIPYTC